jgi:hypothetical protein
MPEKEQFACRGTRVAPVSVMMGKKISIDRHAEVVERAAVRIWEMLESEGEMSLDQIKVNLGSKVSQGIMDEAVEWLLKNGYATRRPTPKATFLRSDGTPLIR